jgi:hypothetical protein
LATSHKKWVDALPGLCSGWVRGHFRNFLEEIEVGCSDTLMEGLRDSILKDLFFFRLQSEMYGLITGKDKPILQLSNDKWTRDNVFLADMFLMRNWKKKINSIVTRSLMLKAVE